MKSMFGLKHHTDARRESTQSCDPAIMDIYERADDALGSIYWALRVFDRDELLEISNKFLEIAGFDLRKPLEKQTETELRDSLRKCALKLYRHTPEKLEPIRKYLVEFGRAHLKGLFE